MGRTGKRSSMARELTELRVAVIELRERLTSEQQSTATVQYRLEELERRNHELAIRVARDQAAKREEDRKRDELKRAYDKALQEHFSSKGYRAVEVFCSGSAPRNNVGRWPCRSITTEAEPGTFSFYAAKDRAMAEQASAGGEQAEPAAVARLGQKGVIGRLLHRFDLAVAVFFALCALAALLGVAARPYDRTRGEHKARAVAVIGHDQEGEPSGGRRSRNLVE